jgi:lipoprotein-anchoring transpeptidase ErfK/SrfK
MTSAGETRPRSRLLFAVAASGLVGLSGCVSSAGDTGPVPVGSITPTAEMVPWRGAAFDAPPSPGQPRRPSLSVASPFATDDGRASDAPAADDHRRIYAAIDGEAFPVPAVPLEAIDPAFLRTTVAYPTSEPPGTIVVDPAAHYLYLVEGGGRAIRYGVGVGREGFGWSGDAVVQVKRAWPAWYPPKEMIARQPSLRTLLTPLAGGTGMAGGPGNPLGARALYLWQNGRDTLYRIHGTVEPASIGKSVSSGCIRMIDQDVIDLYQRVPEGARVVVLGAD